METRGGGGIKGQGKGRWREGRGKEERWRRVGRGNNRRGRKPVFKENVRKVINERGTRHEAIHLKTLLLTNNIIFIRKAHNFVILYAVSKSFGTQFTTNTF